MRNGFELHLSQSDRLVEDDNPGNGVYFYLEPVTAAELEAEFRSSDLAIHSPLSPREWRMNEFAIAGPDANLLRFGEPEQNSHGCRVPLLPSSCHSAAKRRNLLLGLPIHHQENGSSGSFLTRSYLISTSRNSGKSFRYRPVSNVSSRSACNSA